MLFSSPAQPVLGRGGPQGPGGAGAGLREKGGGGGREAGLRDGAGACQGWFSGETGKGAGEPAGPGGEDRGLRESPREGEAEGR